MHGAKLSMTPKKLAQKRPKEEKQMSPMEAVSKGARKLELASVLEHARSPAKHTLSPEAVLV